MSATSLSVVVPATDLPPTLNRCVAAIEDGLEEGDELIVVTEASGPGPAAARNEGAGRAANGPGRVLVFVDADVIVAAGALAEVRRAFAGDPGLAALFGSYDDAPAAPGTVSRFRNLLHHHVHHEGAGPATTFWAGLGAVRAERFAAVGGFDAELYARPSIEDIELGVRLVRAGDPILLEPSIQGTHLKRWTLTSMLRTDLLDRGVPWVELLAREEQLPDTLNLGARNRVSALAAVVIVAAALLRRGRLAAVALVLLLALNRRFYALLARRLGPGSLPSGVALHIAHLLAASAAVPLGLARTAGSRQPRR